jgi:uncharacterized protein involved in exopolysaccharide biosynthesis
VSTDVPYLNLTRVLKSGWWLIVASTVLFALIGAALSFAWPTTYEATSTVEVSTGNSAVDPNMPTEQTIAQSSGVLVVALRDLTGWKLSDLREALSVTVPHNAEVLDLTVKDSSAKRTADAANAVARAYLDDRLTETDSQRRHNVQLLESQIRDLQSQISATTSHARRQALENRLATLTAQYAGSRADVNQPGRILSYAEVPTSPATPGLVIWVAVGALIGLLLGVYVASVRERVRRSRRA